MGFFSGLKVVAKKMFGIQTGKRPYQDSKIDNFGQVDSNFFRSSDVEPEEYGELKTKFGIKSILDLTDYSDHYVYVDRVEAADEVGLKYIHIPMKDDEYPSFHIIPQLYDAIKDESNYPMWIHCAGGRHRTGVVVGMIRDTFYGWDFKSVYEEMKKYDWYSEFGHTPLLKFIKNYIEGRERNEK